MTTKERTIALLRAADIEQDDWDVAILVQVDDLFARGYLKATINNTNGNLDQGELKDMLLRVCDWSIWGITH